MDICVWIHMKRCMGALRTLRSFLVAVRLDGACRPPRAPTLSLHIPVVSWVRATHRDSYPPLTQLRTECVHVCVLCIPPSTTSAMSSRHIYTSPSSTSTCHFLPLTISSRSVYFSKHGCRGAEESGSVARLPRGQE